MRFKHYLKENTQEFLKTHKEIRDWASRNLGSVLITIDENLTVNIDGDVTLSGTDMYDKSFINLPIQFGTVSGDFSVIGRSMTTLKGCPKRVGFKFDCSNNNLRTLKGGPTNTGTYNCSHNQITNFEGAPTSLHGHLIINDNSITSLIGIADHVNIVASNQEELYISMDWTKIQKGGLGFIEMEGLSDLAVYNYISQNVFLTNLGNPWEIIRNHIHGDRNVFACQQELIEAGFEEYAQL